MDNAQVWKESFEKWPADVRRRGVLVTSFGEQIPFSEFMTSPAVLLVQRTSPDTVGARMVLVSYSDIVGVKITDPLQPNALAAMGFGGGRPR